MTTISSIASAVAELGDTFSGQLLKPADADYDEARRVHNGLIDKRPALIARCRSAADVASAVNLTQRLGLEAAVRGGGRGIGPGRTATHPLGQIGNCLGWQCRFRWHFQITRAPNRLNQQTFVRPFRHDL